MKPEHKKYIRENTKKKTVFLSILLIVILGFTVYGNSLKGEFLWDDDYLIKKNLYIQNPAYLAKIFSQHIAAGSSEQSNLYRPLQMLTLMLDYRLWEFDVRGYHLMNTIFHILVALGIFWLINILYQNLALSLLTSLFFVVHPVHTEAVAYISGRADSLASFFMLLSFIFYLKCLRHKTATTYIIMLISFALALLSKETSLILPLLLLLYHYSFKDRFQAKAFLSILSLTFIYSLLRVTVLSFPLPEVTSELPNLFQRLPGFFVAITSYMRLILLPLNLHMEYGQALFRFSQPQAMLGVLIVVSLLIYAIRQRSTNSLITFSIGWFFIGLLPASNIYFINAYMAEHWLYLPLVGFSLILARLLSKLYSRKHFARIAIILAIGLLTFYGYLTIKQNNYWREPTAFYERTLKYAPQSQRVYLNFANKYYFDGKEEKAISLYKKVIEINPNYAQAYNNLAALLYVQGKREEALSLYKKAIAIDVNYADAYHNLANAYSDMGKEGEAVPLYEKAIAIKPNYEAAYVGLGIGCFRLGREEQGLEAFKMVIAINPNNTDGYNNLAVAYYKQSKYQLSIKYCDQARARGLNNATLLEALKPYRFK